MQAGENYTQGMVDVLHCVEIFLIHQPYSCQAMVGVIGKRPYAIGVERDVDAIIARQGGGIGQAPRTGLVVHTMLAVVEMLDSRHPGGLDIALENTVVGQIDVILDQEDMLDTPLEQAPQRVVLRAADALIALMLDKFVDLQPGELGEGLAIVDDDEVIELLARNAGVQA